MSSPASTRVREDAELVRAALGTERQAYGELFQRWYDRCYDVAWNICRNRETAADIAQDAFLVCWERLSELRDPAAFGGWILRVTRNRALNRLERDRARTLEPIETEEPVSMSDPDADPAIHAERDDRQQLVWTAAGALGERDTSLLDLHLRHGLEPAEIAQELQITPNNAHQLLYRLRAKLRDTIGAALLWRQGRPTCEHLATLVAAGGSFDARTARIIRKHQRGCSICSGEMSRQTDPERLFAAVPLVMAPLALKQKAFAELVRAGVPLVPVPGGETLAAAGHLPAAGSSCPAGPAHVGGPTTTSTLSPQGVGGGAHRLDPTNWPRWMVAAGSVAALVLGALVVIQSLPDDSGGGSADSRVQDRAPVAALPDGQAPADRPGSSGGAQATADGQDPGSGASDAGSGNDGSGGSDGSGSGAGSGSGDQGSGGSGNGGSDGDRGNTEPGTGTNDPDPGDEQDEPGTVPTATPTNRVPIVQPTGMLPVAPTDPTNPSAPMDPSDPSDPSLPSGNVPTSTTGPSGDSPAIPILPNPGPRGPGCWKVGGGWFGWWIWWPCACHSDRGKKQETTPTGSVGSSRPTTSPTSAPVRTTEPVKKTPRPDPSPTQTPTATSAVTPAPSPTTSGSSGHRRERDRSQYYWWWYRDGQQQYERSPYHDWCSGNAGPGRGSPCNGGDFGFR